MGLFDKVLGKESGAVSLTKTEGFAAIAVAAVAADGEISQEEIQRSVIDLATLRAFRGHDMREMGNTLNKVAGLIKRRGPGPVLQAAKGVLGQEEAQAAFFVAADLALADGVAEDKERKFLEEIKGILQVDDATAMKIVEVVIIKNRA
ncbi:MAG: putative tellurite resistance protein TerB [Dehalococcoidia bacterium]|nr:putative tellurite resistance protein TerB [Dehalococcoidia bacterium]